MKRGKLYPNLRAEMSRADKRQIDVARAAGINASTFNRKLNGYGEFNHKEMVKIAFFLANPKRPTLSIEYLFEKE